MKITKVTKEYFETEEDAMYIDIYKCARCGSIFERFVSCTATMSINPYCVAADFEPKTLLGKAMIKLGFFKTCNGNMKYYDSFEKIFKK